jgi:hypothetical protein
MYLLYYNSLQGRGFQLAVRPASSRIAQSAERLRSRLSRSLARQRCSIPSAAPESSSKTPHAPVSLVQRLDRSKCAAIASEIDFRGRL